MKNLKGLECEKTPREAEFDACAAMISVIASAISSHTISEDRETSKIIFPIAAIFHIVKTFFTPYA
jgi:hypothetical protein